MNNKYRNVYCGKVEETHIDKEIKVIRDNVTKVISSVNIVDVCE